MRIALIVNAFPRRSETFIVSKFLGLVERGHDVHIVCSQMDMSSWTQFPALKNKPELLKRIHVNWRANPRWIVFVLWPLLLLLTILRQPTRTMAYFWHGWALSGANVFRSFFLDAQLIRLKPDIVHFEFGAIAAEKMYLGELLDCKIVVSFRGYDINYVGLDKDDYYHQVWDRADYLHFLGHDLWQRAQRRGCPANKPHMLIPPAIDTRYFNGERAHTTNASITILSVGRLEWIKGYEFALQSIRVILDSGRDVHYRIIGDGKYLEALAFCRHQLHLDNHVEFMGGMSQDAVHQNMKQVDIFLHAAVSEGFCNAVIEAQGLQLPVVVSDAGGLTENIEDGVTGYVVPRRNPDAIAEKLLRLMDDPDLRRRMGQAGRERVEQHFKIDEQISAFERLYRQVVSESNEG